MKKIMKIIPLVLLMILIGYNSCYANPITTLLDNNEIVVAKVTIVIAIFYILAYITLLLATCKDKKARQTIRNYFYFIGLIIFVVVDIYCICNHFISGNYAIFISIPIIFVIISLLIKFTRQSNIIPNIICVLLIISYAVFMEYSIIENSNYIEEQLNFSKLQENNQRIKQYEGKKSGTQIRTLLQQILESNTDEYPPIEAIVDGETYIKSGEKSFVSGKNVENIATKKKYNVEVEESSVGENKGTVNRVVITELISSDESTQNSTKEQNSTTQKEDTPVVSSISEEDKQREIETNNEINDFYYSQQYKSMSESQKIVAIENLLKKLEQEGKIKKWSYDSYRLQYYYVSALGAGGLIMIRGFADDLD